MTWETDEVDLKPDNIQEKQTKSLGTIGILIATTIQEKHHSRFVFSFKTADLKYHIVGDYAEAGLAIKACDYFFTR